MQNSTVSAPALWKRVGILVFGLLVLSYSAFWPMYGVSQGVQSITLSFKAIVLGAMLTAVGLSAVFLGEHGVPWKRDKSRSLTPFQKSVIAGTVVVAIAMVAIVWFFFSQRGYSMKF